MTDANDNAYPMPFVTPDGKYLQFDVHTGLSKREYFAAIVLQGLVANSEHRQQYKGESYLMPSEIYTEQAVSLADALINQLNKSQK